MRANVYELGHLCRLSAEVRPATTVSWVEGASRRPGCDPDLTQVIGQVVSGEGVEIPCVRRQEVVLAGAQHVDVCLDVDALPRKVDDAPLVEVALVEVQPLELRRAQAGVDATVYAAPDLFHYGRVDTCLDTITRVPLEGGGLGLQPSSDDLLEDLRHLERAIDVERVRVHDAARLIKPGVGGSAQRLRAGP